MQVDWTRGTQRAFEVTGWKSLNQTMSLQIYKDVCREGVVTPYLSHVCGGSVQQVQFCPFEDVLGVGHLKGFTSLIIPGQYDCRLVNMHESEIKAFTWIDAHMHS